MLHVLVGETFAAATVDTLSDHRWFPSLMCVCVDNSNDNSFSASLLSSVDVSRRFNVQLVIVA